LDAKPDGVIISSPTAFHIEQAIKAGQKGCHLFIEKPLSYKLDRVDALIKIVKKEKLKVLIGFCLRFHKQMVKIKELLDKKAIGRVYCARLSAGNYLPNWRPGKDYSKLYNAKKNLGGGVVFDLIHEIDYALWLFGEPIGLNANIFRLSDLKIETEDYAEIFLKFKNSVAVQVHLDYLNRKLKRSCEIIGEFGNIEWDYVKGSLKLIDARNNSVKDFSIKNYDLNDMYVAEMKHFLNCIKGKEKPLIDIYEGKKSLRIALAARKNGKNNIHLI
jgi:predicted dehydrogenase